VHEPLGNVILEAWANRALLVSTRAQGPLELMQDGVNGLLAPLSDAAGLAEALHAALALDDAHKMRLIAAGHDEVERHYAEAAIVSAYVALYAALRDEVPRSGSMRP
jgi:glycosyltransferase involved in cell wall biosynthesis